MMGKLSDELGDTKDALRHPSGPGLLLEVSALSYVVICRDHWHKHVEWPRGRSKPTALPGTPVTA
jgi:hypothetical protein